MDEGKIPTQSYGILEQKQVLTDIEEIREQFLTNGYAILDAGLSGEDIATIQADFDTLSRRYITHYGSDKLKSCDEYHTVRAPLLFENSDTFLRLALNPVLLEFVSEIDGIKINGIDLIRFDADGRIVDFKVMVRPIKAVNKLWEMMAAQLQASG